MIYAYIPLEGNEDFKVWSIGPKIDERVFLEIFDSVSKSKICTLALSKRAVIKLTEVLNKESVCDECGATLGTEEEQEAGLCGKCYVKHMEDTRPNHPDA